LSRKSPFDVRSVDPAVVELILDEVVKGIGQASLKVIDERLREDRFRGRVDTRLSRKTSAATDELVELSWFGLLRIEGDSVISDVPLSDLKAFLGGNLRKNLENCYYTKEILYRLVIDVLRNKGGSLPEKSLLEALSDSRIDPGTYPGYGLGEGGPVLARFNRAKLFYIVRAGRKLGVIDKVSRHAGEGESRDALIVLTRAEVDIRIQIVKSYGAVAKGYTSIEISTLWNEVQSKVPSATKESFDNALLQLRDTFFPAVDLFQASGQVTVRDPVTNKYYHHVRMDMVSLESIMDSLRTGGV